ncbi:MAG: polyprenyl synthetase family protein [Gammaproteobacteria bacterium]|nr:polyprenyl synthetase family protein [Gammaproteobacteria bacterium]
MHNFEQIQDLMKVDINKVNDILISRLDTDVNLINQMSHYIITSGGKRLRPLLLLLCAKATNYDGEYHYPLAVVIELIHTATLLHDDVVDESNTRRGGNSANEIWGNAASVLVGDFLYSRAFEIMVEPDSMKIMRILSQATNKIAEGEVMQLLNIRNTNISQSEYYGVIERKTACLFEAACQIGAILSNAPKMTVKALSDYGLHLGNAFQVIDDVLDYESSAEIMGKEVGDDLAEGKITLPMIYALEKTSGVKNKFLKTAIKNPETANINDIVSILTDIKAFEFTRLIAENESNKALKSLENIPKSEYQKALSLLCELSLNRKN